MKRAAIIKFGGEPIAVAEVGEYKDPLEFLAQKDRAEKNLDEALAALKASLARIDALEEEIRKLWREIAIDRGEDV